MTKPIRVIDAVVCGVPALICVYSWERFQRGNIMGLPEDCYPDEGGYGEWEIRDRDGKEVKWLEDKLADDAKELERVEQFVFDVMEGR